MDYGEFIADVGALAMGATTYEWILDYEFTDKDPSEWKWPCDVPAGSSRWSTQPETETWIVGGGDLARQFADVGLWTT